MTNNQLILRMVFVATAIVGALGVVAYHRSPTNYHKPVELTFEQKCAKSGGVVIETIQGVKTRKITPYCFGKAELIHID
ncbi:hypothetical protein VPHD148_0024 [Vibrio phage D148]